MNYYFYPTVLGEIYICEEEEMIVRIALHFEPQPTDCLCQTPLIKECYRQLTAYFKGVRTAFDLPMILKGTPFQQQVWRTLQQIPYGETRTYGEISQAIGTPKGSRAVGAACNRNPLLIAIPCHRVVGSQGNLTGYAEGLETKAFLLRLEQVYK